MAVSAGFVGGPDLGALVGFFAGLTLDLLLPAPMGLAALAYCLAGYAIGVLHGTSVRTSRWQAAVLAAAGSAHRARCSTSWSRRMVGSLRAVEHATC